MGQPAPAQVSQEVPVSPPELLRLSLFRPLAQSCNLQAPPPTPQGLKVAEIGGATAQEFQMALMPNESEI